LQPLSVYSYEDMVASDLGADPLGELRALLDAAGRMRRLKGTEADRDLARKHVEISNYAFGRVTIAGQTYATQHTRPELDAALASVGLDPYQAGKEYDGEWAIILHEAVRLMVEGMSTGHVAVKVTATGVLQPVPAQLPDRQIDPQGVLAIEMAEMLSRSVYDRPKRPSLQCEWCGGPIPDAKRGNRRYCRPSHAKSAWRAERRVDAIAALEVTQ
jgi:hypothetical protein